VEEKTELPAAEWTPLSRLKAYPRNPRRNQAAIPVVADSIKRFGFNAPVVARSSDGTILAGHARIGAAQLLAKQWAKATTREKAMWHADAVRVAERAEVVCRFVELDEHDSSLYLIADNAIAEHLSETDDEQLAAILRELRDEDVDITLGTGLSDEEIARLLDGAEPDDATGTDPGDGRYREQYGVIVICADEAEQERVYNELKEQGRNCRVVTT
jgi:ParB-like chromosome segregation protein Spo0J